MKSAVEDAGLTSHDIAYVNAHATSTPLGDAAEILAIDRMFDGTSKPVKVSSTKGVLGVLLAAAVA